jgi:tetratricopeptide (TPR) repeat protein
LAAASLERSAEIRPGDPVLRYRLGKLYAARGDQQQALVQFEGVIAARPSAPPAILAASSLEAARILERLGDRTRAIELYRRASRQHGAPSDTRRAATQSLVRLKAPE